MQLAVLREADVICAQVSLSLSRSLSLSLCVCVCDIIRAQVSFVAQAHAKRDLSMAKETYQWQKRYTNALAYR